MQDDSASAFREGISSDSEINKLIERFEDEDTFHIAGHIGDRGDGGHWNTFQFEVIDVNGDTETITLDNEDIPDGTDWDDLFDYLDYLAEEYDVEYENSYGESE